MAFDMFLKIDGIDGESLDQKHEKWIEILSFSWGIAQNIPSQGSASGKTSSSRSQVSDFNIQKYVDTASPKLFEGACHGSHYPTVDLTMRKAGGEQQEFFKIKLYDVLISGVQSGGAGASVLPMEAVSFSFGGSLISSFDDRGQATNASTCGAASFPALSEGNKP